MELQGNYRVYCRIRPISSREIAAEDNECVTSVDSTNIIVKDESGKQITRKQVRACVQSAKCKLLQFCFFCFAPSKLSD